jgi:hypothetical protein
MAVKKTQKRINHKCKTMKGGSNNNTRVSVRASSRKSSRKK